jgi:CheY-like chemotaxis protein
VSWVDSGVAKARALVVDSNPSTRIGLATMLREYGVEQLQHTSSAQDARRMLELRRFDIVVCDMHFPNEPMTGQDLLDDLRLANLLPLSTVFILLSPDAVYAKVAEAAEAASDGYLIKPHTQKALRDRLAMARQRKHALKEITDHIEREAFVEAAQLCQQRVEQRSVDWLPAARIGAELWLRVGQPRAALAMFESIYQAKAIPWASSASRAQITRPEASRRRDARSRACSSSSPAIAMRTT